MDLEGSFIRGSFFKWSGLHNGQQDRPVANRTVLYNNFLIPLVHPSFLCYPVGRCQEKIWKSLLCVGKMALQWFKFLICMLQTSSCILCGIPNSGQEPRHFLASDNDDSKSTQQLVQGNPPVNVQKIEGWGGVRVGLANTWLGRFSIIGSLDKSSRG